MKIDTAQIGQAQAGSDPQHDDALERIARALKGLRFGSVEIVVQDSRVVQIERKEKFRLDRPNRNQ